MYCNQVISFTTFKRILAISQSWEDAIARLVKHFSTRIPARNNNQSEENNIIKLAWCTTWALHLVSFRLNNIWFLTKNIVDIFWTKTMTSILWKTRQVNSLECFKSFQSACVLSSILEGYTQLCLSLHLKVFASSRIPELWRAVGGWSGFKKDSHPSPLLDPRHHHLWKFEMWQNWCHSSHFLRGIFLGSSSGPHWKIELWQKKNIICE